MARWPSQHVCTARTMTFYALLLSVAALGVAASPFGPYGPGAPGVVFALTPDYGAALIHLGDGTSVPVAQIQGSPSYQAFMKENEALKSTNDSTLCRWLSPGFDCLSSGFGFDVDQCQIPEVLAVKSLISALKKAVESYLGTNICFATLSLDDISGSKSHAAEQALQAAGLRQVLSTIQLAIRFVSAAYGYLPWKEEREEEEPRNILAVDYSAHWVNAGFYTLDEGMVLTVHSTIRNPLIVKEDSVNERLDALRDAVKHALEQFSLSPPEGQSGLPQPIHRVLVYGDAGGEEKKDVLDLLRGLLGEDLVRDAHISQAVFDAITGLADTAQFWMATVDFEMREKAAWGCKWRSGLYREDTPLRSFKRVSGFWG